MNWLFYVTINIIFDIVCYLTNPIVILFADEYGNLPRCLRWWQTYDNCLDIDFMVIDVVPKIFRYDFNKHYHYYPEIKTDVLMIPGRVVILDPNFTMWERVQRYFCRLAWLYRNNGYGFAYEICGRDVGFCEVKKYVDYNNATNDACYIGVVKDGRNFFTATWSVYLCKKYCKWFYLRVYLGWKIKGGTVRAMLACHVNPFRLNK